MFVNGNQLGFSDGVVKRGYYQFGQVGGGYSPVWLSVDMVSSGDGFENELYTAGASGSHSHSVSFPSHNHTFSIDNTHNHAIQYGIYEDSTIASNVGLYVNGQLIRTGLNGTMNEIDIKNYVRIGRWNEIEFSSTTNGCIYWDLFMKSFNLF